MQWQGVRVLVKISGYKILFLSVFFGLGQNFCVRKTPDDATAQGMQEVERIRRLDSRRFEVTCYNGTREIRTKNDLLRENVCNFSRSNDIRAFCVSRDQDNKAPWVFSTFENGKLKRLQEMSFNSGRDCFRSLGSAKKTGDGYAVCSSLDSDGKKPYSVYLLDSKFNINRLPVVFDHMGDCVQNLERGFRANDTFLFCSSVDGDNKSPFMVNKIQKTVVSKFSSPVEEVWDCWRSLQARPDLRNP